MEEELAGNDDGVMRAPTMKKGGSSSFGKLGYGNLPKPGKPSSASVRKPKAPTIRSLGKR